MSTKMKTLLLLLSSHHNSSGFICPAFEVLVNLWGFYLYPDTREVNRFSFVVLKQKERRRFKILIETASLLVHINRLWTIFIGTIFCSWKSLHSQWKLLTEGSVCGLSGGPFYLERCIDVEYFKDIYFSAASATEMYVWMGGGRNIRPICQNLCKQNQSSLRGQIDFFFYKPL